MKDIVWGLIESLRGQFDNADALELVLRVLVWEKWSSDGRLPPPLCLTRSERPQDYVERWQQLGSHDGDLRRAAFRDDKNFARLGEAGLQDLVNLVLQLRDTGVLQHLNIADVVTGLAVSRGDGELFYPPELADLMLTLGELRAEDTLYTPWDTGAQLSVRGTLQGAAVYLETPLPWRVTLLIGLLAGGPLAVRYGDPIRSPQAIEEGKPRHFDVAIAFPPLNQRYEREVAERDWFGRFPEKTTSGTILSIRHLLAQARRRVVVAVTPSFLFGRGEAALRIDLLQRGMVQAVVALPGGILSGAPIAIALLVLDPRGGHRTVRFVNAENERFVEPLSKARSRLTNTSTLGGLILTEAADPDVIVVSVEEILANDAQLQVSRYVVPPAQRRLREKLAQARMIRLDELVTTLRPQPVKFQDGEDTVGAWEVGPTDLPAYGYIQDASRSVSLPREMALQKSTKQFLLPHDIVLIVKGGVGKVGIVPPEVPPPGEGGWVAAQSAMVLRVDAAARTDPRTLFLQLRSPLGQALLQSIVSGGATMQMINLSELKALQVLQPTAEEQAQAAKALDEEVGIQQQIERLRKQQSRITLELWPLD
ncbi:N-6 DNA methylase [Cupriavidus sp. L7L]|uniref:N-6 DNA methylase n=1 Tax=Cupriavidus sp. L7L TaxID=2546443 RepID=UPI001055128E|nr:N-6 DNA methylase [Cupriavidus sp. L7L]TDF62063.1 hypothetical protein E1J61_31690 [Cupriavidus sp. L7L]